METRRVWECKKGKVWVTTFTLPPELYPLSPSNYFRIQAWDHVNFCDPTGFALAQGFIEGNSIQPLMDWALDNVELGGWFYITEWYWDSKDCVRRNRTWLEEVVKEVANT